MSLRHALLGLLDDDQPASGYELLKVFDSSLANAWPATQSQVYSELNRLADEGLITVSALGPRGRKDYAITVDGKRALRDWLAAPPVDKPVRSDMLLRVFFLNSIPVEQARELFAARRERVRAEQERLREIAVAIAGDSDPISIDGRIALEFGLRKAQMELEWAEWAIDQLNASAVVWRR
jgi:DNA-binding PadR family transcriptional regulator